MAVDVIYIKGKPVLHLVDEATHYMAAVFLRNLKSETIWRAILKCWSHVYVGPPEFLHIDQGSSFISQQFRASAEVEGIQIHEAPIENPASMSHTERYHGPLHNAFIKLKSDFRKDNDADLLQTAIYCLNNMMGPEGLCPSLCVFGTLPKPVRPQPCPNQLRRAKCIDNTITMLEKDYGTRKLNFAQKYRGPFGRERDDLQNLPFGSPVRVYRPKSNEWEGLFKFVSLDGDTVCVQLPHGRRIFRSHVVKTDSSSNTNLQDNDVADTEENNYSVIDQSNVVLEAMFNEANLSECKTSTEHTFDESMKKELEGLEKLGVFKVIPISEVPKGEIIYNLRWVHALNKDDDDQEYEKSRVVGANFRDRGAKSISTKAPTISRMGTRVGLHVACRNKYAFLRDIIQAYI